MSLEDNGPPPETWSRGWLGEPLGPRRPRSTVTAADIDPCHGHCCIDCGRALNVGDTQVERLLDMTREGVPVVEYACEECERRSTDRSQP